jgi:hypothetical protein
MPKAVSSPTKGTLPSKKATPSKSRTPVTQQSVAAPTSLETSAESVVPTAAPPAPTTETETPVLASILQRLDTLEEKITDGFAALVVELRTLNATPPPAATEPGITPEVLLPPIADVLRHNLMEHLTPITAAMKRLEERIGFVANRLKFSGGSGGSSGGQDRQKPWRGEQGRHAPRPPRGQQNGQPRPAPPPLPQWTPPSAASVQGHFAPRPSPARGFVEEDD